MSTLLSGSLWDVGPSCEAAILPEGGPSTSRGADAAARVANSAVTRLVSEAYGLLSPRWSSAEGVPSRSVLVAVVLSQTSGLVSPPSSQAQRRHLAQELDERVRSPLCLPGERKHHCRWWVAAMGISVV